MIEKDKHELPDYYMIVGPENDLAQFAGKMGTFRFAVNDVVPGQSKVLVRRGGTIDSVVGMERAIEYDKEVIKQGEKNASSNQSSDGTD